jgi:hypothetical protein
MNKFEPSMKKSTMFLAIAAGLLLAASTSGLLAVDAAGTDSGKAGCCINAGTTCCKEVTITGSMVCGKCKLHVTDKCQSIVQVEKDGKTINYCLADNETAKSLHKDICSGNAEKVTATGTLAEKDGKQILTASKIEVVK